METMYEMINKSFGQTLDFASIHLFKNVKG